MSGYRFPALDLAWWLAPLGALVLTLGVVLSGAPRAVIAASAPATPPKADLPALLPEYSIPGVETRSETVERTLFNPTRRPAPTPQQEGPKPKMPRGQFALTGTTVVEGLSTAFLREVNGGRFRRVRQGDTVNGMLVAEVKPDRVKLTMGDESEELVLKVVANPRPTPAPVAPAGVAAVPGAPPVAGPLPPGAQPPQTPDQAQSLAERRRAARAAAAAGGAPTPGEAAPIPVPAAAPAAVPMVPPTPAGPQQNPSSSWSDVFRRYQQRPPDGTAR